MEAKLVILESFPGEAEANIVKEFLKGSDIVTYVFKDDPVRQFSLGVVMPVVRLMVSSDDLEKAIKLLKDR